MDTLLSDYTTRTNILWATDAYAHLGTYYERDKEIHSWLLVGEHLGLIQNRAAKAAEEQTARTRRHAEVFTPLWICKMMNDYADETWFYKSNPHPFERDEKIKFPSGKRWQHYIDARRLEITCGEAPYLVSRYDAATGADIPLAERVGMLDRKLRIASENAADEAQWIELAARAFQSVYGYEYQGDNLLIARVNLLMTFEEYMYDRWQRTPTPAEYRRIADIIARNLWQMDGLCGTVPYCKRERQDNQITFFDDEPPEQADELEERIKKQQKTEPHCRVYNWRQKKSLEFLELSEGGKRKMLFDFVIGNPPYQEERQGDSNTATPIYHKFMDAAYDVSDKVMLITPARFLFNTGYTPKKWNQERLNDPHFKIVSYYPDASEAFTGVDIKGGVAISYRDLDKDFGAIEVFTTFPLLNDIFHKVIESKNFISLSDVIITSFAYHFTQTLYDENPELVGRASKGHDFDLQSNIFDTFPEIFFDESPTDGDYIRILGRKQNQRCWKYIKRSYVTHVENLDTYKLFFSKANGTGQFGETLPEGVPGLPGDGATITFLSIGSFSTMYEVDMCQKYLKTKFARALLGVLKATQNGSKPVFKMIPLQDFTPNSDIDWSRTVAEIDRQLYAKYDLDEKEIEFIESHVKQMS